MKTCDKCETFDDSVTLEVMGKTKAYLCKDCWWTLLESLDDIDFEIEQHQQYIDVASGAHDLSYAKKIEIIDSLYEDIKILKDRKEKRFKDYAET